MSKHHYDAIVVGSGISGGWAAKELTEKGLNTLLLMADLLPDDPLRYGDRFRELWGYVDANLIDHERGGWYEGGLDKAPDNRGRPKAHIWKAAYHDSRALMNVIRRLEGTEGPPRSREGREE